MKNDRQTALDLINRLYDCRERASEHTKRGDFRGAHRLRDEAFTRFQELTTIAAGLLIKERMIEAAFGPLPYSSNITDEAIAAYDSETTSSLGQNEDEQMVVATRWMLARLALDFKDVLIEGIPETIFSAVVSLNNGSDKHPLTRPTRIKGHGDVAHKRFGRFSLACVLYYTSGYYGEALGAAASRLHVDSDVENIPRDLNRFKRHYLGLDAHEIVKHCKAEGESDRRVGRPYAPTWGISWLKDHVADLQAAGVDIVASDKKPVARK